MEFYKYLESLDLNKNLTQEELLDAIKTILEKNCHDEEAVAFLVLLKNKIKSTDDLKACLEACQSFIKKVEVPNSIELGYSFEGKGKQPFLFPLYSNVLKEFFEKHTDIEPFELVLSGDSASITDKKVTTNDIFKNIELEENIHFFDRKEYFEELSNLNEFRNNLHLKTVFNTIEKLLNPANSKYAITSASKKVCAENTIKLFCEDYENIVVVQGNENTCEVFDDFDYWIKKGDYIIEKSIKLEDLGIKYNKIYENLSLEDMQKLIKKQNKELMKIVKLNVAILLFTANKVESIESAYEMLSDNDCCVVRFWKWLTK